MVLSVRARVIESRSCGSWSPASSHLVSSWVLESSVEFGGWHLLKETCCTATDSKSDSVGPGVQRRVILRPCGSWSPASSLEDGISSKKLAAQRQTANLIQLWAACPGSASWWRLAGGESRSPGVYSCWGRESRRSPVDGASSRKSDSVVGCMSRLCVLVQTCRGRVLQVCTVDGASSCTVRARSGAEGCSELGPGAVGRDALSYRVFRQAEAYRCSLYLS